MSYLGSIILGMGFTFDDENTEATPLRVMHALLSEHPEYEEAVVPYIGGKELNSSPQLSSRRWVINFGDLSAEEAERRFPKLFAIVREKVRPGRVGLRRDAYRDRWWLFAEPQRALCQAMAGATHVLATCRVSPHLSIARVRCGMVFSESTVVFPLDSFPFFAILQSRTHELWARFLSSSMKDDLRYSPTTCFRNFPFPENWVSHPALEAAGKAYCEFRAALMVKNNEGLTKTYNRFHDPNERDPEILRLRELHAAMDRAVLDAYGWSDVPTDCDFFLDYEIDEEEWGDKKKPWRYRWPDDVRDDVLARLLELNSERAKHDARSGAAASKKRSRKSTKRAGSAGSKTGDLF
jgi:hypothetical protein